MDRDLISAVVANRKLPRGEPKESSPKAGSGFGRDGNKKLSW